MAFAYSFGVGDHRLWGIAVAKASEGYWFLFCPCSRVHLVIAELINVRGANHI